jgi:cytochrome P450
MNHNPQYSDGLLFRLQTVSAITSFILLMALHPEVQGLAQAEIDEICGRDQAPQPVQLGSLTYLLAVLKEVLRYAPVGNLGTPTFITMNSVALISHWSL